ncbi:MAG: hypothetical protein HQM10_11730 [Candidatus Riflebacteria bacterium]|nr:hypothetical protein [Candidatus Riflebacteria bacterium]
MKSLFQSRCGCFTLFLCFFLFVLVFAAFQKHSMQAKIEKNLHRMLDSLNGKLENANDGEKVFFLNEFLRNNADFDRVNLIDNFKKEIFGEIHKILDDYHLLLQLKLKSEKLEAKRNYLIKILFLKYANHEKQGAEEPSYDELKFLEGRIVETYNRLLKIIKENRTGGSSGN